MKTPKRDMRIPRELWRPAAAKARRIGTDLTAVERQALIDYVAPGSGFVAPEPGGRTPYGTGCYRRPRIADDVWLPARDKAQAEGLTMTAIATQGYRAFLAEDDAVSKARLGGRVERTEARQ